MRWAAVLATLAAIGLCGASEGPASKSEQPNTPRAEQDREAAAEHESGSNPASADYGPQKRAPSLSAYERESLAVDREANRIAKAQGFYAFWQVWAAAFTVTFAGIAAFFAWRATYWTKRAADIARSALESLERPFLVIEVIDSGIEATSDGARYGPARYHFRNYGRTPAILTRRHFTMVWGTPEPVDPIASGGKKVAFGVVIGSQERSPEYETDRALPILAGIQQVQAGRSLKDGKPHLIGFVQYRDLMGNEYVTGFCLEHDDRAFDLASWVIEGERDPYNYDRKLTESP